MIQFTKTSVTRAHFLSPAWRKLKLCSANYRPGYWSNLPCNWPSTAWAYFENDTESSPGARPTNGISIEFEIRSKFAVFWFKRYSTDHNKILHTSRQCNCRDVCKILLWWVEHISLVGRAPSPIKWSQHGGDTVYFSSAACMKAVTIMTSQHLGYW